MADHETRTIKTEALARVEGEGAMQVKIRGGEVENVELQIYEPPRFFEAFLRGRDFKEAPDITARICGICPVAYITSAFNAMEDALDVQVDERIAGSGSSHTRSTSSCSTLPTSSASTPPGRWRATTARWWRAP